MNHASIFKEVCMKVDKINSCTNFKGLYFTRSPKIIFNRDLAIKMNTVPDVKLSKMEYGI